MRSFAFYALPLALTATDLVKAWGGTEQFDIQNFYYTTVPSGAYVNYVTFTASVSGIYTTCTNAGSVQKDVWYDCDNKSFKFRLDKDTGELYIQGNVGDGCLSGQTSFEPSGTGDGWTVPSIGIQLSDQNDWC